MRGNVQTWLDRAATRSRGAASYAVGALLVVCALMFAPAALPGTNGLAPGSLDRPTGAGTHGRGAQPNQVDGSGR